MVKLKEDNKRCRPSMGRRCIPDVALKNQGSMVQTCRNINVHVVNTWYTCWNKLECIMDCMRKQDLSMCTKYKLKNSYENMTFRISLWWAFLKKDNQFFGFPWCSTREDLSIDVSITNVGLILTKIRWFLFSGYGQTDTVLEFSYGNMSAHKKFQLKAQN